MIHKQISLPERLNEQITQRAKRLQTSEEQVIRDLLSRGLSLSHSLGGSTAGTSWRTGGEALRTLGELGIEGPADLAMQHDDEYRS